MLTGEDRSTRRRILFQRHFVHHKLHVDWPGIEPGPPRLEVGGRFDAERCLPSQCLP